MFSTECGGIGADHSVIEAPSGSPAACVSSITVPSASADAMSASTSFGQSQSSTPSTVVDRRVLHPLWTMLCASTGAKVARVANERISRGLI
jgi:hypothetical protein